MGDSITEGTIIDLPVAPGEFVQSDDVVVVIETDKVAVDVRAPAAGALVEILGEVDDVVEVGSDLFRLDTDADAPEASSTPGPKEVASAVSAAPDIAAPAAPKPPVVTEDVPTAAEKAPPPPKRAASSPPPATTTTVFLGSRTERRTKMSRMRQRVAERLKSAQNTAAML